MSDNGNGRRPSALNALKAKITAAKVTKNWPRVAEMYAKYGAYLELTGDDGPAEKKVIVIFPKPENS